MAAHHESVQGVYQGVGDSALRVVAAAADGSQVVHREGMLHVVGVSEHKHLPRLLPVTSKPHDSIRRGYNGGGYAQALIQQYHVYNTFLNGYSTTAMRYGGPRPQI